MGVTCVIVYVRIHTYVRVVYIDRGVLCAYTHIRVVFWPLRFFMGVNLVQTRLPCAHLLFDLVHDIRITNYACTYMLV